MQSRGGGGSGEEDERFGMSPQWHLGAISDKIRMITLNEAVSLRVRSVEAYFIH
jgi:hypothetical protein